MNRRSFLRNSSLAALAVSLPALEGCNTQSVLLGLLNEMQTGWVALEAALGKTVPPSVIAAFGAAVNAVKGWVPGTPIQGVVEALQILSNDVSPLLAGAFPLEVAAADVVLGTIVNLIEFFDPNAVPPVAGAALAHSLTYKPAQTVKITALNSWAADSAVRKAKADFDAKWKALKK